MFRNTTAATPADEDQVLMNAIPLSVLELDIPTPTVGWGVELDRLGVAIVIDDIGRRCVSRAAARELITEHRENEARKARLREETEQRAIAADRQFRAQLSSGVPWYAMPAGVDPARALMEAELDAEYAGRRRRRSVLEDALDRTETLEFHSLQEEQP
jgi:hypothetical protein